MMNSRTMTLEIADSKASEPHQPVSPDASGLGLPATNVWRALRHLWCQHRETVVTPKTQTMPAHVVCRACGWREPVMASTPKGTRTWDSTRDEDRYEREKQRRVAAEQQRQMAVSQLAVPVAKAARPRRSRQGHGNIVQMSRTAAQ
jgi:hypothetical protein